MAIVLVVDDLYLGGGGGPRELPADAGRGATSADNGRFRQPGPLSLLRSRQADCLRRIPHWLRRRAGYSPLR